MIKYTLCFDPNKHTLNIKLEVETQTEDGVIVSLPRWTPGSYCIRDYARHITKITARDGVNNEVVSIQKLNDYQFKCGSANHLVIEYSIYAFDQSVRGCHLDSERAFINGSAAFLMVQGFENKPIEVAFQAPKGWEAFDIATQLKAKNNQQKSWGVYESTDYDSLIDSPITIGEITWVDFTVKEVPHQIAITGPVLGDLQRLKQDVQKICNTHVDLFQEAPPFNSYLFLMHFLENGYGGLEHADSSALIAAIKCQPGFENDTSKDYELLLGLFSHEYFHVWNIKRIKPQSFVPYDLTQPSHTNLLWVFEGFTAYYDDLTLARSKTIKDSDYLRILANSITRVLRSPGRKVQSLAQSSFDAWTKFYFPNEDSPNQIVSYYVKGSVVACLIDMKLRLASENEFTLDHIMRELWEKYGKTGVGLTDEEIFAMLTNKGIPLDFLQLAVYGTEDLPIDSTFEEFGLNIKYLPRWQTDKYYPDAVQPLPSQGVFDWQVQKNAEHVKVLVVYHEGAASEAGICPKDEVVAINGIKLNSSTYDYIAKGLQIDQTIEVVLFRENLLKTVQVCLKAPKQDVANISLIENPSPLQQACYQSWLQNG